MKTKVIRIYLKDWYKIRKMVKGVKDETVADYFDRVAEYISHLEQRGIWEWG